MRHLIQALSVVVMLIGLTNVTYADNIIAPDSTKINVNKLKPAASFLLAQGKAESNPWANYASINPIRVTARCPAHTIPYFKSSLVGTYDNQFYATGGIVNTLRLTSNYWVEGIVYMSNRGAVGANNYSPVTMNWQVWCSSPNQA